MASDLTYSQLVNFYDRSFILSNNRLLSTSLFVLYLPIGLALLIIRFVLLLLLYTVATAVPSLNTNPKFINLVSLVLGIFTQTDSVTSTKDFIRSEQIFVSNHITCFDHISIKSLLNKIYSVESADYLNKESFFLAQILKQSISAKKIDSFSKQILYFPEKLATNGTFKLLKFDFGCIKDSPMDIKPICLRCSRPFPFSTLSVNPIESNQLINLILFLFSPVTIFKVDFSLEKQSRQSDEPIERFAQKVGQSIASKLGLNLCDFDSQDFESVWNQHQNQAEAKNDQNGRLALQIKQILPDVTIETIEQHIRLSSSLDIDTVMASILDSDSQESSLLRSESTPVVNQPRLVLPSSKSNIFPTRKERKNISFEERKFELVNEARKRYLSRDYNQTDFKHNFF
ncbi:ancient ubiquitous 1 [Brachionus plicatilis]|uniref:Ancient ubiquitous 1 n=1 Tax=Brachionus plicatilis TaxID=10195 RepID=A0A3M7SIN0_BRAPC|nr:ancient ubiquitous 1 [Brachionus plicatilis]